MRLADVTILQLLPGPARPRVPGKGTPASTARAALMHVPGMAAVDMDTVTGTVSLTYDVGTARQPASLERLADALHTLSPGLEPQPIFRWLQGL